MRTLLAVSGLGVAGLLLLASLQGGNAANVEPVRGRALEKATLAGRFEGPKEASLTDLEGKLTPLQLRVTQQDATEPPFRNEYWDNHEAGIYVDVVSGEPLFSSLDKFESGTGWPSFSRPLEPGNVKEKRDFKMILPRTEVRSQRGDSHLGHLFPDGPNPTGLRYCINSAALRFIPTSRLEAEGYGQYAEAFAGDTGTAERR